MARRPLALALAAALAALRGPEARGDDVPPAPAPAPAPTPAPSVAPAPATDRAAELRRAEELNARVVEAWRAGQFGTAEPLAREALAIRERLLGPDDPLVAASLLNLGAQLEGRGRYADARALYERSLEIREKALGPDHLDVATSLNNLAGVLREQGAHAQARPLYERALAIVEKALGPEDPEVATRLSNLAGLLKAQGAYAQARPLYERALAILEKALGKDHPELATVVNNFAVLLQADRDYPAARVLFERALAIRERVWGRDHLNVAASVHNLATNLHAQGAYAEARSLYERALAIRERELGKAHPVVARGLCDLAQLLGEQGADAQAREEFGRALAIDEQALGAGHPEVARILNAFALHLRRQGALAEARPLHERALAIREQALGRDHPDVAGSLNNLADLLHDQGAFAEARPLYERALAVLERALGEGHPGVGTALNNLATLRYDEGAYAEARALGERALAIHEQALGKDHLDVAGDLANLAVILEAEGDRAAARPLCERALAIRERARGRDDRVVASSVNNLAGLLQAEGAHAQARALYERAIAIWERALGPDHPMVALGLANLATVLEVAGAYAEAKPLYLRALAVDEAFVRSQLSALSASQRLALVRSVRLRRDRWVALAPRVGESGHAEALRLRGVVARAEAAERALARRAARDPRDAYAALKDATRMASRLANEVPESRRPEARAAWQARYAEAAAERERLTRELTSRVAPAREALERLDLTAADVRRALPSDTALVDVLRIGPRYVAWVMRATGETTRVELGATEGIESAAEAFVLAVADDADDAPSRAAVERAGAGLRARVWAPLEGNLGDGVRRVVLCPDAALASVPFAALPGRAPGAFLGDEFVLSHVFHPFDLVPRAGASRGTGALVVGGVDYDHADRGSTERRLPERPPVLAAPDRAPRGGAFVPIPATRAEAEALRDRFGKDATTLLTGADATEARVREGVKGRRFVHVATHGFARTDLLAGLYDRKIEQAFLSADAERQLAVGHDPMLLSGLALAGANPRDGAGGDDGILTALEASYLDLDGVELVTLSACETAKGTAESGEGVLGLVSAIQMAGAHGVLASLWKVDDEATRSLMEGVYARMLRTEDPRSAADALREAARALRTSTDGSGKARFAAPRYWAAFVAYGG